MRVSRHDDDCLIFVRRPGILAVTLAILAFTMLALAIRSLRGGDTGAGVFLLVLSAVFAAGMIAMTSFQELRFDRAAGLVERHSRGFFKTRHARVALQCIEAVSVDQGEGGSGRRYYRPILLLRDLPGGTFTLSTAFGPYREAHQMTLLIDAWLKRADRS